MLSRAQLFILNNSICKFSQFSSANSDDLWAAMQAALDESNVPHDNYKVKEVMDTWTKQSDYPLVTVIRNYKTGETTISQKHFHPRKEENKSKKLNNVWSIPVTFTTNTNRDFSNTVPNYWLKDQNLTLQTGPVDWIIVNLQQTGE